MERALKVAVQMDPIETINIDGDSTFALMLAAQQRGHALWHYEVKYLTLREGVMKEGAIANCGCSPAPGRLPCSGYATTITGSASRCCSTSPPWTWC